jgi:hypothetical protein
MILKALQPYAAYFALAAAALVFTAGWKVRDWQCKAATATAAVEVNKELGRRQGIIDAKSREFEELRATLDTNEGVRTNTIREIFRAVPSPPAECDPPAALRGVLASAVSDANAAASGQPVQPVLAAPGAAGPTDRP